MNTDIPVGFAHEDTLFNSAWLHLFNNWALWMRVGIPPEVTAILLITLITCITHL